MFTSLPRKISLKISYTTPSLEMWDQRQVILQKKKNETFLHIIIKLLSYIYYWDKEPIIEPSFRYKRFRPDLIVWKKMQSRIINKTFVDLWMECKNVKLVKILKLGKVLPNASIVWINGLNSSINTLKLLKRNRNHKIPLNIILLGIDLSSQNWNLLTEYFTNKQIKWNVIREKINLIKISNQKEDLDEVKVKFKEFVFNKE